MTISFEMAPKGKTCRLVTTVQVGEDIQVTILHKDNGFIYFMLSEIKQQAHDIQIYINKLIPKIKSGKYQAELVEMEKEEICC
ncbi:hypothetical protein [Amphibacillus cookii]|uniref:hypothetical protein n=1 Tax=Amphibacillus cookii TaxID=767787 RepID=UPI00195D5EB3|nr:hypothetical protein [Amphibacillus cookii]MBM7541618.1 hypothetical protein [Amphibacillus cookii]